MKYNRCLRCELNYTTGNDSYCQLCQRELAGDYLLQDEINIDENLCPYCDKNLLGYGEEMCYYCHNKRKNRAR